MRVSLGVEGGFAMRNDGRAVDANIFKSLSKLIKSGRLYAVKDWLADESRKTDLSVPDWISLLEEAIETGFHSMVELFLEAREWSKEQLGDPLNRSLWNARLDLVGFCWRLAPRSRKWISRMFAER